MKRNIASAFLLILLAASLVLWKLNILPLPGSFAGVGTFGMIVAVFMVIILFWGIVSLKFSAIFFPIAILCIVFDEPLGITALTPWTVLIAALLLTVAFNMIFPWANRFDRSFSKYDSSDVDNGESVSYLTRFSEGTKYIRSKNLKKVRLSTKFGDLTAYMNEAEVPDGTVTICCEVAYGNMDLFIPADWNVENKIKVTLGDCEDDSERNPGVEGGVNCLIEGHVKCGAINIKKI